MKVVANIRERPAVDGLDGRPVKIAVLILVWSWLRARGLRIVQDQDEVGLSALMADWRQSPPRDLRQTPSDG